MKMSLTDLHSPFIQRDIENQINPQNESNNKQNKKCDLRLFLISTVISIFITGIIIYICYKISSINHYSFSTQNQDKKPHPIVNSTLGIVKYFGKYEDNPMYCKGDYCWSWQTPNRIVCTIENYANAWDIHAIWSCEAYCPDGYDLDTVHITCVSNPSIEKNPHIGCKIYYTMIDNENDDLDPVILLVIAIVYVIFILIFYTVQMKYFIC